MSFITAVSAIGGLTLILAGLLVVANKKLYVEEDPRIDEVDDMLPHANCGACGFPGCRPFAEALVTGQTLPGKCSVSSEEERAEIAAFLGVDVGAEEKRVAPAGLRRRDERCTKPRAVPRPTNLRRGGQGGGWRQRLLLGLSGVSGLPRGLRFRRDRHE